MAGRRGRGGLEYGPWPRRAFDRSRKNSNEGDIGQSCQPATTHAVVSKLPSRLCPPMSNTLSILWPPPTQPQPTSQPPLGRGPGHQHRRGLVPVRYIFPGVLEGLVEKPGPQVFGSSAAVLHMVRGVCIFVSRKIIGHRGRDGFLCTVYFLLLVKGRQGNLRFQRKMQIVSVLQRCSDVLRIMCVWCLPRPNFLRLPKGGFVSFSFLSLYCSRTFLGIMQDLNGGQK